MKKILIRLINYTAHFFTFGPILILYIITVGMFFAAIILFLVFLYTGIKNSIFMDIGKSIVAFFVSFIFFYIIKFFFFKKIDIIQDYMNKKFPL